MTIDERKECFIRKAIEKWGDLYDYSNVRYVNARTKVEIVNKENGRRFWITPDLHLRCGGGRQDEHKEYGYWNDKDKCLAESKKYSCKFDFERKSYGAYHSALRNGWLDEFFKDCSNDDRYNDFTEPIHCVYVYEIESLNSCYIGRTSRISVRDRQHRNGVLRHGVKECDSLHEFCEDNGIEIPTYKILSSGLTAVESQAEEERWLNEYKDRGWNVLNKGSVGVGIGSLGSVIKWTHDKCLEESRKYKSREGMKKGNPSAYNSSYRNGWLMEFFPKLAKRSDGYWNNIENCKMAASDCNGMKDLFSKYGGAYNAIRRNKWQEIIKNVFKENKKDNG